MQPLAQRSVLSAITQRDGGPMSSQKSVDQAVTNTVISRRGFLKLGAVIGGTLGLVGGGLKLSQDTQKGMAQTPAPEEKIFRSANNPECNHCALHVHVRNGKAVRLTPDPNFYIKPCLRGYSRIQGTYDPDRLKYPFKRVGERGEGKWERISWDEALGLVAENLAKVRDEYGAEAVMFLNGAILSQIPLMMIARFKNAFGEGVQTGQLGQLCCAAQAEASAAMLGYRVSEIENFAHSKLQIAWGHNPAVSYLPHWRYIADGIAKGMRLVTIDPKFTETAAKSDQWLAPRPGTDLAMALGMMKVIIEEGLYDVDFVMTRTNFPFLVVEETGLLLRESDLKADGDEAVFYVWDEKSGGIAKPDEAVAPVLEGTFEVEGKQVRTVFTRLRERVATYTPAKVQEISGVDGEQVVNLAREYATIKPAMINSAMSGAQRVSNGEFLIAAFITLASLTGNYGIAGGGVNDTAGVSHWAMNPSVANPYKPDVKGRIPATLLGEWMLEGKPYPIKAVYWQGKGLGQQPNVNKLREALLKMDFVVVQEQHMTDAAQIADVILPVSMLFERYDLMSPIRNFYYQLMDKAIEPMWESHSDTWIYTELAKRLGFGDLFDKTEEEWIDEMLINTGLTVKELREKGPVWMWSKPEYNRFGVQWDKPPFYWFKDTPFETPSGRLEIHSARWEKAGMEPMVDFWPAEEGPLTAPELMAKYPLQVTNHKINAFVHSTYQKMKWVREIFPQPWVDMHVEDAAERGISDGDMVEVFNDRGKIKVAARVHTGIIKGVISLQNGWWIDTGGNASVITNDAHTKQGPGYGHILNSTLAEVRRA
jgi:anaerobic selenocysteine-containing dehydrogenase